MASSRPARSGALLSTLLILLGAAASAAVLLWAIGDPVFAAIFFAGVLALAAPLLLLGGGRRRNASAASDVAPTTDLSLLRAALDCSEAAAAVTDAHGQILAANEVWQEWFGARGPLDLPLGTDMGALLVAARRDGRAGETGLQAGEIQLSASLRVAGLDDGHVVWTLDRPVANDLAAEAERLVSGETGDRLGLAGVMSLVADPDGNLLAASRAFLLRATADGHAGLGTPLVDLLTVSPEGALLFARDGKNGTPLRIVQVPLTDSAETGPSLFLLLEDAGEFGREGGANINALLEILPLGLALADRDGRFIYLNSAFRRGAGLDRDVEPTWPGDLVVDEDKAAVSDSVRRFARGPSMSGDIAVRLRSKPEEPVAMTVAGARGLGDAAVLLSLKDNTEEDRLKRQVAQATKMQAVGQLAGGVAHDFNNILTAIIGHCDLMLMRHTPGDSDYDDIQQIRSNSNRAAGLTRQLLAFSRQQTLRPQVLQLPDVIAEVSNLLKRLLGEKVSLQVKHGRALGAVRADPGQLEQVIVNLAVNARDAMPEGGALTIQTYSVSADDVRRMGSEILPIAEYTALRVTDTGSGIPANVLPKIFEPFFTTKEVGKGTGLGLSTVYGIVKQSGGFIFAESQPGQGTSFVIYLPVNRSETPASTRKVKETTGELWGSGTILLVEDEATVRAVAERALTRHGYTVLLAENGEAAIEILEREPKIDLMISDVVMPTMDGPTTARIARQMNPDLPILFISGYAEEQLRQSIDLERVSFLAKPFSVQKLAESARDALAAK
ncbi:hybrid sensor histidine kinase/response regulator [Allosphingosinicella deserti]|uniref:histidine kinase n=1 Tax=Allosphingosinicella deserti TaxID=2116704 RepID=A0A2P7QHE6_9SPHN|nr:PAS domain-containing sensor histidine kinase [Sphingomonas deserti]PSJ37397.1 hybrid sensor histidine kinase/response regulator [Sphingomonas deserti]